MRFDKHGKSVLYKQNKNFLLQTPPIAETPMSADLRSMSRKEREFLQRREAILATALHLFAEKGFHKVSMSEIARESEFSVGSLYNFFPNKEALYKALMLEKTTEICKELDRAVTGESDECIRIRQWVERKVDLYRKNTGLFKLFFSETMGTNFIVKEQISTILKEKQKKIRMNLATLFEAAMGNGKLAKNCDPFLLSVALDGICNTLLSAEEEYGFATPVDATMILDLFSPPVSQDGAEPRRPVLPRSVPSPINIRVPFSNSMPPEA